MYNSCEAIAKAIKASVAAIVAVALTLPAQGEAGEADIVDVPVAFGVVNTNRSAVPCPSDDMAYQLRGHLVAPREILSRRASARAVTVYMQGDVVGEPLWRLRLAGGDRTYDHSYQMARLGHASVTISALGFGPSDVPANGFLSCLGSFADMAHQVVVELKEGNYTTDLRGFPGSIPFGHVALAGNSGGSLIAEIAAFSFADLDGIVLMGNGRWGESNPEPFMPPRPFAVQVAQCLRGGDPKPPTGVIGFVLIDVREWPQLFVSNPDPGVWGAFGAAIEADPCGAWASVAPLVLVQQEADAHVTVPVVIINGKNDRFHPSGSAETHANDFVGTTDKRWAEIPGAGHLAHLDHAAAEFRAVLSHWLKEHRF